MSIFKYGVTPSSKKAERRLEREALLARVETWTSRYAPREWRWCATDGPYDLGCVIGSGPTPEAAIQDLVALLEADMDEKR